MPSAMEGGASWYQKNQGRASSLLLTSIIQREREREREEKMGSHVVNNITAEVGIGFRLPSSP
jgi:hypothetical protein